MLCTCAPKAHWPLRPMLAVYCKTNFVRILCSVKVLMILRKSESPKLGAPIRACILSGQFRPLSFFAKKKTQGFCSSVRYFPVIRTRLETKKVFWSKESIFETKKVVWKYFYLSSILCVCFRAGSYSSVYTSLTNIRSVSNFSNSSHQLYIKN